MAGVEADSSIKKRCIWHILDASEQGSGTDATAGPPCREARRAPSLERLSDYNHLERHLDCRLADEGLDDLGSAFTASGLDGDGV